MRRRRHLHRSDLRHSCRRGRPRQDADDARRPIDRRDEWHRATRRALRNVERGLLPPDRHRGAWHHHRGQHDDRDERRQHRPPGHAWPPRRDRDATCAQGRDLGSVLPRADTHRAATSAHPHPRTLRLRRRGAATARRRRGAGRHPPAEAVRLHVDRRHVPVLLREPRPREPHARTHPRGIPRRRARLAVARGDVGRSRVRASVDHAGERLRRSAHRQVHLAARRLVAVRRLRRTGVDHAGDGWRHAARLRRQEGRHVQARQVV